MGTVHVPGSWYSCLSAEQQTGNNESVWEEEYSSVGYFVVLLIASPFSIAKCCIIFNEWLDGGRGEV